MLMRLRLWVTASLMVGLVVSSASAATVTYTLAVDDNGPGTFSVLAQASAGDNGGIVTYGIPIVGPVLTIDHLSPNTQLASNASSQFGPAGFTEVRSPDNQPQLAAGQAITNPSAHILYGFGQSAGSFAASGLTPIGPPPEQPVWGLPLLIATGTYASAQGSLDFGRTSVNLLADVFQGPGNPTIISADLNLVITGGGTPPNIVPVNLGPTALAVINAQLQATGDAPISWDPNSLTPASGSPAVAATLSSTGAFQWHTIGSARPGLYSWNATATNAAGADTDVAISLELVVPEPASMALVSLAVVGLVGLSRRRK